MRKQVAQSLQSLLLSVGLLQAVLLEFDANIRDTAGGPLPRFEGINSAPSTPAPLQAQGSGGPIRVPPLAPDKASQYAALFVQSGAQDGFLSGWFKINMFTGVKDD